MGLNCLKATEPLGEDDLDFTSKSQKLIPVVWSTSEGWKASTSINPLGLYPFPESIPNFLLKLSHKVGLNLEIYV